MGDFQSLDAIKDSIVSFDINAQAKPEEQKPQGFFVGQEDLEDALYGEAPEVSLHSTMEDFAEAHRESERARIFSRLAVTEEGRLVERQFVEDAQNALETLTADDGLDYSKHQKLVLTKNCTQYALRRYRDLLGAVITKPILRK